MFKHTLNYFTGALGRVFVEKVGVTGFKEQIDTHMAHEVEPYTGTLLLFQGIFQLLSLWNKEVLLLVVHVCCEGEGSISNFLSKNF